MADVKHDASQLERQQQREKIEIALARQSGKGKVYIDEDGCEVTISPDGHSFYNVADWW